MRKGRQKHKGSKHRKAPLRSGSGRLTDLASPSASDISPESLLAGEQGAPASDREAIASLIRSGANRKALQRAKELHWREKTRESEQLLVQAYLARIEEMIRSGMSNEARELIDLVASRHADHREEILFHKCLLAAWNGDARDLLRPLASDDVPPDRQRLVMDGIRRWVTNPLDVATCDVLPAEHPLRRSATALAEAFEAVTSGPVTEEQVALSQVSRRSPFAPWKLLVRALAALYRGDDDACRAALEGIEPGSAPARLTPAIHGIIDDELPGKTAPCAVDLHRRVSGGRSRLRKALGAMDHLIENEAPEQSLVKYIRDLVQTCEEGAPEHVDRLRIRISVRCFVADLSPQVVRYALGDTVLRRADFWLLLARAQETLAEETHHVVGIFEACFLWDRFRHHAIDEGWFAPWSPEESAVLIRMVELLTSPPRNVLESSRRQWERDEPDLSAYYEGQPPEIRKLAPVRNAGYDFVYPERLFAMAAAANPEPSLFRRWLEWTRATSKDWRSTEEVAQAWHRALPDDPAPLIFLMEAAEERNALTKAVKHLEAAEALDRLNVGVRLARVRLLTSIAIRHIKTNKLHMAERDLELITALPGGDESMRMALVAALRWCIDVRKGDFEGARSRAAEISSLAGGELAAVALLVPLYWRCGLPSGKMRLFGLELDTPANGQQYAMAAARANAIGETAQVHIPFLRGWIDPMTSAMRDGPGDLQVHHLVCLARSALRDGLSTLAYSVAGAGLEIEGPHLARFLLFRARSLPITTPTRARRCLRACATLARREGNTDILNEALEGHRLLAGRFGVGGMPMGLDALEQMSSAEIAEIVRRERARPGYPSPSDREEEEEATARADQQCDCPACRRRRGELPKKKHLFDGFFESDEDEEDDDDWAEDEEDQEDEEDGMDLFEIVENLPPEVLQGLFEVVRKDLDRVSPGASDKIIESMIEVLSKYGSPDRLPPRDRLERTDPELAARLDSTGFYGNMDLGPFPAPRGPRRPGRRNRRGRR